jgi:hypothetical protein
MIAASTRRARMIHPSAPMVYSFPLGAVQNTGGNGRWPRSSVIQRVSVKASSDQRPPCGRRRCLGAAEGHMRLVVHRRAVDVAHAGFQPRAIASARFLVAGHDARRQPVFGVVVERDGLFVGRGRGPPAPPGRRSRLPDSHVGGDAGQDRRLDEAAQTPPPSTARRPWRARRRSAPSRADLLVVDQRADDVVLVVGVAGPSAWARSTNFGRKSA